jgi:hypothetical protein
MTTGGAADAPVAGAGPIEGARAGMDGGRGSAFFN